MTVPVNAVEGTNWAQLEYRDASLDGGAVMLWTPDVSYKLDTTAPSVDATVDGFDLSVSVTDPLPEGVTENSGVAACEYRVGDGAWEDCQDTAFIGAAIGDRAITVVATDSAGNETAVEVAAPNQCTQTYTGSVSGPLSVTDGVLCLDGATVRGRVTIATGASVVAEGGRINGGLTASDAYVVSLDGVDVSGRTMLTGTTGAVSVTGSELRGTVHVDSSTGSVAPDLSRTSVRGTLSCTGNNVAPVLTGAEVAGRRSGQCAVPQSGSALADRGPA